MITSGEHAQNGRGVKRTAPRATEFPYNLAPRSRARCASVSEELEAATPHSETNLGGIVAVALAGIVVTALGVWTWHLSMSNSRGVKAAAVPRIAVLPFRSSSGEPEDDRLGVDLTNALVGALAASSQVRVSPPAALQRYANAGATDPVAAGRELGVSVVVIGTVQRRGGRARVEMQMVSAQDARQIWAGGFDADSGDIPGLSAHISKSMAGYLTALLD